MRPGVVYDVAVVLGGSPERLAPAVEAVLEGKARYLLHSGRLSEAGARHLTSRLVSLGVPRDRVLLETRSRNTRENAVDSSRVLTERGFRSVLLVTSAAHVERAVGCFRRLGIRPDVLAIEDEPELPPRLLPRRAALALSEDMLHEVVGRVVYRLVGYSS